MCSKRHDPAHFTVKTPCVLYLSCCVFGQQQGHTGLWMLEHSLLRSLSLSCSTPRLFIPVKSDVGQSCLDRSDLRNHAAVWTQHRDRSFKEPACFSHLELNSCPLCFSTISSNTCNLILRLSDLPTYQRAALSVPFNEVCHWRGDDPEGPR